MWRRRHNGVPARNKQYSIRRICRAEDAPARPDACVGAVCTAPRGSDNRGIVAGIGAEYALTGQYGIRLEYEDYGKITVDDVLSTGSIGSLKASAWTLSAKIVF